MEPEEWANSAAVTMSDGVTLHFLHTEDALYVGIAGNAVGAVNVIVGSSDRISILHSSAALGSAVYARSGSAWELVHGFEWCCRRGSEDSARAALLEAEGWEANIGYAGDPGVVEYAITMPWQDAVLAVSSIGSDDDVGFWPTGLSPEAQDQLVGVPPQERQYDIDAWGTLTTG